VILGASLSTEDFDTLYESCQDIQGVSLAEQLGVECADGTAAADCVPECDETVHGYLMLLNIEGDDSKFSCQQQNGLHSWVGSAVRCSSSLSNLFPSLSS
jgi:hypothetical protein